MAAVPRISNATSNDNPFMLRGRRTFMYIAIFIGVYSSNALEHVSTKTLRQEPGRDCNTREAEKSRILRLRIGFMVAEAVL